MSFSKWLRVIFFTTLPLVIQAQEISYADFDASIKRYGVSEKPYNRFFLAERYAVSFKDMRTSLVIFREQFSKLEQYLESESQNHKIPKVVHQIWLGKPMPEKFKPLTQTWAEMAGWEYRLWTEKEVAELEMVNRELFDKAKDYGEASDILRLEILYQEGGLYVDTDFECLDGTFFDKIHDKLDFYAAFEPLEHGGFKVCNAIMASRKGHGLVKRLINDLQANCEKYKKGNAIERTGPNYITRVIFSYYKKPHSSHDILFPPTYFYPTNKDEVENGDYFVFPESVAFHYWSGSWIGTLRK